MKNKAISAFWLLYLSLCTAFLPIAPIFSQVKVIPNTMHAQTDAEKQAMRRAIEADKRKLEEWQVKLEKEAMLPEWYRYTRNMVPAYVMGILDPIGFMIDEELKARPDDEGLRIRAQWLKNALLLTTAVDIAAAKDIALGTCKEILKAGAYAAAKAALETKETEVIERFNAQVAPPQANKGGSSFGRTLLTGGLVVGGLYAGSQLLSKGDSPERIVKLFAFSAGFGKVAVYVNDSYNGILDNSQKWYEFHCKKGQQYEIKFVHDGVSSYYPTILPPYTVNITWQYAIEDTAGKRLYTSTDFSHIAQLEEKGDFIVDRFVVDK